MGDVVCDLPGQDKEHIESVGDDDSDDAQPKASGYGNAELAKSVHEGQDQYTKSKMSVKAEKEEAGGDDTDKYACGTNEYTVQQGTGGTLWRLMWVEVGENLLPKEPINVKATLHGTAPTVTTSQPNKFMPPKPKASTLAPPTIKNLVIADATTKVPTASEAVVVASGSNAALVPGASSSSVQPASHVGHLLEEMHGMLQSIADPGRHSKWLHELPKVVVKETYLAHKGPPAKGDLEDGKEKQRGRGNWPSTLKNDIVEHGLDDFKMWLYRKQNKKEDHASNIVLNVGRALGALKIIGSEPEAEAKLTDVKALVAFYTSNEYLKFANMDLMHPKYGWTIKTIDALACYCQFHLYELAQKSIRSELGPWDEYSNVLHAFVKDLRGGFRKRCEDQRAQNIEKKKAEDLKKIKNLPQITTMQEAVHAGYIVLQHIATKWAGQPTMPSSVRALANACLCGGINLDTFMGRSMEWELLKYVHAKGQVDDKLDYIVCTQHKTSKTYGDLAKWLSPGLVEAIKCYMSLPRHDCDGNLLLPAQGGCNRISFASCLHTFCKKFLPAEKSYPTVNLVRKWLHTSLMKLTDTKDKLKEVMLLIDAHSKSVQDRHYWLREPEDDVKLAKLLVHTIFGATVPWPDQTQVAAFFEQTCASTMLLQETINGSGESLDEEAYNETKGEDDDDFDCLDWWEAAGDFFGIPKSDAVPLTNTIQPSASHPHEQQQLVLASDGGACEQRHETSSLGDNVPKQNTKKKCKGAKAKIEGQVKKSSKHCKKHKKKTHKKLAKRLNPLMLGKKRKAAGEDEVVQESVKEMKKEKIQEAASSSSSSCNQQLAKQADLVQQQFPLPQAKQDETDEAGVAKVEEGDMKKNAAASEVIQSIMKQYSKHLEKNLLQEGNMPGDDFFKALLFVLKKTGKVTDAITNKMLKKVVAAELSNPSPQPEAPAAPYEGKGRKKITKELDAFIVNSYLDAVEEHGPDGCKAASSSSSNSTVASCLLQLHATQMLQQLQLQP